MQLTETRLNNLQEYNTWLNMRREDYPSEPYRPPFTFPAVVVWHAGPRFLTWHYVYLQQ